jgi:phosphatidylglycerophosphate synthase
MKNTGYFIYDRLSARNAKNFTVQDKIFTRANLLTFSGVLAVGFYIVQFSAGIFTAWIPVTKIYIAATDMFDGWLADKYNEHSKIGKAMDPWRDRLDAGAVLLNVWYLFGSSAALLIFAVVAAEVIIFCEGAWLYFYRNTVAEVHLIGKIRMIVHQICAFVILVQAYWFEYFYIDVAALLQPMALASIVALVSYNYVHRKELARLLYGR